MDFRVIDIGIESEELLKILVVDDEPSLQSLVFDTLADYYRLITAHNGREGVEKAETTKPALILMDVMMPDMGGYEAVRSLAGNKMTADIPVIMLSAVDFDPSTIEMLKREPNVKGFITKPFRPKNLREIVKLHILRK